MVGHINDKGTLYYARTQVPVVGGQTATTDYGIFVTDGDTFMQMTERTTPAHRQRLEDLIEEELHNTGVPEDSTVGKLYALDVGPLCADTAPYARKQQSGGIGNDKYITFGSIDTAVLAARRSVGLHAVAMGQLGGCDAVIIVGQEWPMGQLSAGVVLVPPREEKAETEEECVETQAYTPHQFTQFIRDSYVRPLKGLRLAMERGNTEAGNHFESYARQFQGFGGSHNVGSQAQNIILIIGEQWMQDKESWGPVIDSYVREMRSVIVDQCERAAHCQRWRTNWYQKRGLTPV